MHRGKQAAGGDRIDQPTMPGPVKLHRYVDHRKAGPDDQKRVILADAFEDFGGPWVLEIFWRRDERLIGNTRVRRQEITESKRDLFGIKNIAGGQVNLGFLLVDL